MKVLVTGSEGRVGRLVVSKLLERGDDVVGFDAVARDDTLENFRAVVADFSDVKALASACEGVDAVLHLGALMSWLPEQQEKMFRANVDGTRHVLAAAVRAGAARFVFASSGEVYPDRNPTKTVSFPVRDSTCTRKLNSSRGLVTTRWFDC